MEVTETAVLLSIEDAQAVGIVHQPTVRNSIGVVVVVGGPQYRVGSHRQFVLLARALAAGGVPVLRFDYRGMGDSSGTARNFEHIDVDMRAAVDALVERTGVARVVLWGLCDAASAALMYAHTDARIAGLVLLNPWVHTVNSEATVRMKTYYTNRLYSRAFWRKLLALEIEWRNSARSLLYYATHAMGAKLRAGAPPVDDFIERMRRGWGAFGGPVLLLLSGDDLTAAEFLQLTRESTAWRALLASKAVQTITLAAANHTFARSDWRATVERETLAWLSTLGSGDAETR